MIESILKKMIDTLNINGGSRLTALRELQREEDNDPFKILIGTILSARTKDENTKIALSKLFNKFSSPQDIANADVKEIAELIKAAGFYNIKARRIKEVAKIICEKYNGKVPDKLEELLNLPGVGRKTANCVLVYAFNKEAIPVDTHVHRIANRLGLVNTKNPEETEAELMRITDRKYWKDINDTFVRFGQNICKPINPLCSKCLLNDTCKYYLTSS